MAVSSCLAVSCRGSLASILESSFSRVAAPPATCKCSASSGRSKTNKQKVTCLDQTSTAKVNFGTKTRFPRGDFPFSMRLCISRETERKKATRRVLHCHPSLNGTLRQKQKLRSFTLLAFSSNKKHLHKPDSLAGWPWDWTTSLSSPHPDKQPLDNSRPWTMRLTIKHIQATYQWYREVACWAFLAGTASLDSQGETSHPE